MPRRKSTTVDTDTASDDDMKSLIAELVEYIEDGTFDLYLEELDIALENRNTRFREEQRKERSQSHAEIRKGAPGTQSRVPAVKRSETRTEPLARTARKTTSKPIEPVVESTGNELEEGALYYIRDTEKSGLKYWAVVVEFVKINPTNGKAVVVVDEKTPVEKRDEFPVGKRFAIPVSALEPKPVRGRGRTYRESE